MTGIDANNARFWNVRPMPSDAMPCTGQVRRSCPSKMMLPLCGLYKRLRQLNRVVLPAPLGPIRPQIVPAAMSNDTPSSATIPPNATETSCICNRDAGLEHMQRLLRPSVGAVTSHGYSVADMTSEICTQDLPSKRTIRILLSSGLPLIVTPGSNSGIVISGIFLASLSTLSRVRLSPARSITFLSIQPLRYGKWKLLFRLSPFGMYLSIQAFQALTSASFCTLGSDGSFINAA